MEKKMNSENNSRLLTIKEMIELPEYSWLTAGALRHHIFQSDDRLASDGNVIKGNGLKQSGAIIRLGRKILIDITAFDLWVFSHRLDDE